MTSISAYTFVADEVLISGEWTRYVFRNHKRRRDLVVYPSGRYRAEREIKVQSPDEPVETYFTARVPKKIVHAMMRAVRLREERERGEH